MNAVKPGSKRWRGTISSSKVPAILGLSPWKSPFALWHEMAGNVEPSQMDEQRAMIGHYAELMLVPYWLAQNPGWTCERTSELSYEQTFTDDYGYPAVATVDAVAIGPDGEKCIVECKTTNDMSTWGQPGDPDAVPAHYYAQVMWQMGVSGIHKAQIIAEAFHEVEIHEIKWDEHQFAQIVDRCLTWWQSLEAGTPPDLDDEPTTYDTVRGLHPDIDKGTTTEVDRTFALALLDAHITPEEHKTVLQGLKTKALNMMGDTQHLMCEGEKIASRRAKAQGTPFLVLNKNAHIGANQ